MDASIATAATWAKMREEGLPTPLAVPLLGLDNGNPGAVPPALLQQQIEWTGRALRDAYPQLMLAHEGEPLMVIFDTTGRSADNHCSSTPRPTPNLPPPRPVATARPAT